MLNNKSYSIGDLFFIETNVGSNIFEVLDIRNGEITLFDNDNLYTVEKQVLYTYDFLSMGVKYLGSIY